MSKSFHPASSEGCVATWRRTVGLVSSSAASMSLGAGSSVQTGTSRMAEDVHALPPGHAA
eukprot:4714170-Pyramimonas_sp.AAC.1